MPWILQITAAFDRQARKFLKRHPDLRPRLGDVLALLERDPFDPSLLLSPTQNRGYLPRS